jgi:hypothetical protein
MSYTDPNTRMDDVMRDARVLRLQAMSQMFSALWRLVTHRKPARRPVMG